MKFYFPIVIVSKDLGSDSYFDLELRAITQSIESEGFDVSSVKAYADLTQSTQQQSRASSFILSLDDSSLNNPSDWELAVKDIHDFIFDIRKKNKNIPIYLCGKTKASRHMPNEIVRELTGFIYIAEDTPGFVARRIVNKAKEYLESIKPPYFSALLKYASDGAYSWHCPGHSGGVAFLKSPVGQMFHQFFGENMLRVDVCSEVKELGQLLEHTGVIADSERNAARIYNADHCFFVTNGTSTSNKIVWHYTVGPTDVVVVDRNCHKSVLHSIVMTGAIPVFLKPTRNHFGIIGPIPKNEFEPSSIRLRIQKSPLVQKYLGADAAKIVRPRIFALTQSTYDGILYNASHIKSMLNGFVDALHFDEAWLPHAAFHPIYKNYHAMEASPDRLSDSLVYATQSSHKLLAGISQASHVLVQESKNIKFDSHLFNEAYLMHTSTSPQNSILASCDVSAAMMEQPWGRALVEESISEAMDFRREMRKIAAEYKAKNTDDWWFKIWGPVTLAESGSGEQHEWMLRPEDDSWSNHWHGFRNIDPDFNMLDPIKATVMTPGLNLNGKLNQKGVPASVVAAYLAENGVVAEKVGLYSFFIMFTVGITKGRWHNSIATLQNFKEAYEKNQPVTRVLPKFCQKYQKFNGMGLADLCDFIHKLYAKNDIAKLTTDIYVSDIQGVLKPSDAYAQIATRNIERVAIEHLEGRIAVSLLTPYPPGIPLIIPGEQFNKKIIDYFKFQRDFNKQCPGFETFIHGLVQVVGDDGEVQYFADCVKSI
jgi:arginine decarboxylase